MNPAGTLSVARAEPQGLGSIRLCRIVTVSQTFQTLLREQLRCVTSHGLGVTLVCSPDPELTTVAQEVGATTFGLPMQRQPAPMADLRSLLRLTRFFRCNDFDIVHSSTPKAGFLAAIAARLAGVPVRIHTFTGQPWVELKGLARRIPRECDRVTARLSSQCYADSPSQRDFLVSEGLVCSEKIAVLGAGSISGVNLNRFSISKWGGAQAIATKRELGIPHEDLVITFVGRVTKDKGIVELLSAFETTRNVFKNSHLLLVGPFEPERDPLPEQTLQCLHTLPHVHVLGSSPCPEKYLAASDIFCLPSYREGFGSVVIEAAALGLPAVVTRIVGLVDAVAEGETGLMVAPKDHLQLAEALQNLLSSPGLRQKLGQAARRRAERDFDARLVNNAVVAEYHRLAMRSRLDDFHSLAGRVN